MQNGSLPHSEAAQPHSGETGQEHGNAAYASLAVFTQIAVLAATLSIGQALSRRRVQWLGEAGVALALGVLIGLVLLASPGAGTFTHFTHFNQEFFFLVVLPPIIFEAGFSMDAAGFFRNIGGIACFAFLGTVVSTVVLALVVLGAGAAGLCLRLTLLEALIFGSIVSATDPVTVLAVFQRLGADPDLYALVFGESVLNDAVAMVLFRSLLTFTGRPVTGAAVAGGVLTFLWIFLGSMAVGAGVAFAVAWVMKTRFLRSRHLPLESSVLVLCAFGTYTLADGLRLSGIVAALFCGLVSKHYTLPNMSRVGRDRSQAFFKLLSTLAETFVFSYIGATLVGGREGLGGSRLLPFLAVCFVALAVSRAANIWPCAALVNYLRTPDTRIPQSHRFMLWWSGLRGAMAFAISLEAAKALPGGVGAAMRTATYWIVLATVLVNGGACSLLLERLGLKAGAAAEEGQRAYQALALESVDGEGEGAELAPSVTVHTTIVPAGWADFERGAPKATPPPALPKEAGGSPPPRPTGGLGSRVQQFREANKSGVLRRLNQLDERYLGKLFLAEGRSVEMQRVHHHGGDVDTVDEELLGGAAGAAGFGAGEERAGEGHGAGGAPAAAGAQPRPSQP